MFSTQNMAALAIGMILAFVIPIAAVIIYKIRNRDTWLPSVLAGAGTFIVFAMILEQILHTIMLPIVQRNVVAFVIYGAFAAGIFEETGRFVAYKLVMKNHYSTNNAIMMGLGHGGFETIYLLGTTYLMSLALAALVNSQGLGSVLDLLSAGDANAAEAARTQLEAISQVNFATLAAGLYERLVAMVFHICMSVIVYHAASKPGKIWLYPAAVLLHAALDVPAAMYQAGVLTNVPMVYGIMTVFTALTIALTVFITKKLSRGPNT